MLKQLVIPMLLLASMVLPGIALADDLAINSDSTINSVLTAQIGKRVTIKIKSGEELSGTVTAVTGELTHLSELTGREYFDAVITNQSIEAVIIRVK